jgi:N6-L-threonylcarbamoyladenine synthase
MIILGIETSCDETGVGIVRDGREMLANTVASSAVLHAPFGGVVPEIAARSHIESILPTIQTALDEAELTWNDIDGIAVTAGPGLLGSLLIGTTTAKTLAAAYNKPLYPVNHVVAHTYANMLIDHSPSFPLLSLSVSGGHSHLIWFDGPLNYKLLGATRDDAAGEAFDKVAKMMGLGYPGGPAVGKAGEAGNEQAFALPKPRIANDSLDFSFSGLKTAVLRSLQEAVGHDFRLPSTELPKLLSQQQVSDMAASFQRTVCEILTDHLLEAYEHFQPKSVVIAGGVAANSRLRQEVANRLSVEMHYAPINLCTDNGAMVAALGYELAKAEKAIDPAKLVPDPGLRV